MIKMYYIKLKKNANISDLARELHMNATDPRFSKVVKTLQEYNIIKVVDTIGTSKIIIINKSLLGNLILQQEWTQFYKRFLAQRHLVI